MRSKRSRFLLILVVLGICFACLWPSISWYACTSKEDQNLALGSLEKIRDYSRDKASADVKKLFDAANADPDSALAPEYKWLEKVASKNYKDAGEKIADNMSVSVVLNSFSFDSNPEETLTNTIEKRYRERILKNKSYYEKSVKLGLDLSGGMNVIVKADLDAVVAAQEGSEVIVNKDELKKQAMTQAIENLTSRIDRFGLSDPVIRQQGEDRIYIELPGAAEAEQINSIIMGRGILNFRVVDQEATANFNNYYTQNVNNTFDKNGNLINPSIIPEDDEVFGYYKKDEYDLDTLVGYFVLKKEIVIDGQHIKSAEVGSEAYTNRPQVNFVLDSTGAETFDKFTSENIGKSMAIVSDNKIKSVASINERIPGGRVAISGFSIAEAQNLQKVLQTAWLTVPLSIESQQVIGASLGEEAIHQGEMALAIGLAAILVFMLIWYRGAGINAVVAQVLNLYIMFSILSAFNLTVTLSSIAGMVLTIGMAVDANVVIFERIKEELSLGKSRDAAIMAGFDNALWAILDSNITTFIAAIFMVQLGTGTIQGFAVSLAIGVVSSLFTALVVSRLIFDFNTQVLNKKTISIGWRKN
ncbi:MAG: protein translocase subunit SecD [Treponema sp.]|nr:protein translocase subunit SecD [Treponema sp.]